MKIYPLSHYQLSIKSLSLLHATILTNSSGLSAETNFTPAFAGGKSNDAMEVSASTSHRFYYFQWFCSGSHDSFHIWNALFCHSFLATNYHR